MSSSTQLPPAVERLATRLSGVIGAAWKAAVRGIIAAWRKLDLRGILSPVSAKQAVVDVLRSWPAAVAIAVDPSLDRIYVAGFLWGVSDTGVVTGPDQGDQNVLEWLKTNPNGFIPALRNMADDGVRGFERVISDAYAGVDENGEPAPFSLPSMVSRAIDRTGVGVNRARLIIRTETAKATAYGRIMAWQDDPERDFYWYHWIATHDKRTKDVSLKFEKEGPYTYASIKKLWEVDHNAPQWIKNRHTGKIEKQTSAFNCRCTVARTPKTAKELYNEGKITYAEMQADEAGGGQVSWRPVAA